MKEYLELVNLQYLMKQTSGLPDVGIGLIDGPISMNHPDLNNANIYKIAGMNAITCFDDDSIACSHGTFIAGILKAKRESVAPALCPDCTLIARPVFSENVKRNDHLPGSDSKELATAINDCITAGTRIINLSLALVSSIREVWALEESIHNAMTHGVIIIAAAGNQNTLGSSAITRHPWVIPVIACNSLGHPNSESNLSGSIGRRGLSAPGDKITSLGAEGQLLTLSGTSVAVPFVTGTIALLWSLFPSASALQIKLAISQAATRQRSSVVPPLLNAYASYQVLAKSSSKEYRA